MTEIIYRVPVERKYIRFTANKKNRHEWKGKSCACGCGISFRNGSPALVDDSMKLWFPVHYFTKEETERLPEDWEWKRISCGSCLCRGSEVVQCQLSYIKDMKWNKGNMSDMKILINSAKTEKFHGDVDEEGKIKILFCERFIECEELPSHEEFKELKCRGDIICEF